jgi:hypothetical protein
MSQPHFRPAPFDLVFQKTAEEIFPEIRRSLAGSGHDPRDRDGFLMIREVVTLLRELRPDEGLGEGIDQLAALLHQAYLFWDGGSLTVEVSAERLADILNISSLPGEDSAEQLPAFYARFPEHRVWAQVVPGEPHEPLDGCFVQTAQDETLRVLGIFGLHRERAGFSVVEVAGRRPGILARVDGSAPFSPTLPGGAAAGLLSLMGEEELLELGWRTQTLAAVGSGETGGWRA